MESQLKKLMTDWDYEKAVALARPIAEDWKKRTVEMARILYVANQNLSWPGFRSDAKSKVSLPTSGNIALGCKADLSTTCQVAGSVEKPKTWEDFCIEIGLPLRTAKDWLACYDPDKDLLLTRSEYKEARQLELTTLYEDVYAKRKKDEGYVPENLSLKWNRKQTKWSETKFQKWVAEKEQTVQGEAIANLVSDRYSQVTRFGLWTLDYMMELRDRCEELTSGARARRFSDLVNTYAPKMPKSIDSRSFMRAAVLVEGILSSLPQADRDYCRALLADLLGRDGYNREDRDD